MEDVGQALARTLDPETLAGVLVRRVPQAMHRSGAALWLDRDGRMELVATSGVASTWCRSEGVPPTMGCWGWWSGRRHWADI